MHITEKQKALLDQKLHTFYNKRPVVVTGGAGFIGSHITELLASYNAKITVLDNLSTGTWNNLSHIDVPIKKIQGSINDYNLCQTITQNNSIIFHCAAQVSVPESVEDPQKCFNTNITGTHTLLHAAHSNKNHICIFSSSSAVYGTQDKPCCETDICKPLSPYGYSKYMGELLCQQYAQVYALPTLSLRYFNVYGPRQNPQGPYAGIIAKLHQCIQKNKSFTLYGTGQQTRDFVPVQTVALCNIISPLLPKPYLDGSAYNCASGTSTTIAHMVATICKKHTNYNAPITYAPARVGDILHSSADCSKLQKLFYSAILKGLEK